MRQLILLLIILMTFPAFAQKIFSEEDLVAVVKTFHPVAKQAALDIRIASANLTSSRGAFDPVIRYDKGRKEFDGTRYYDQQLSEIRIPTWYGIDITAGQESIKGMRLNPEETKGTINYIGVSIPVVQNLVIDKRRGAFQQARIFQEQSQNSRQIILNDLMLEAITSYWSWWEQHHQLQIIQSAVQNAKRRFNMVKTAYQLGERPAIDTLEILAQVQTFEQKEIEVNMELQKSRLELSVFLWNEKAEAYDLPQDVLPQPAREHTALALDSFLQQATIHPELLGYNFKLRALHVDKRLKFQSLLPKVDLKYNQAGRDISKTINGAWFQNNYRVGISMSMPFRLSEGRGGYEAAKLKIRQTELEQRNKQVIVQTKTKQMFLQLQQTAAQLNTQKSLVSNYNALQRGEETKFFNGESSLFLVNARELKTIESQQKLIELQAKVQIAKVKLLWAAGMFGH